MYKSTDLGDDSSRGNSESPQDEGNTPASRSANASVGNILEIDSAKGGNAPPGVKPDAAAKRKGQPKKFSGPASTRTKMERKPKRALSAYNFFFREERARLANELESASATVLDSSKHKNDPSVFTEMGRIVAQRWKEITPEELDKYKSMADEDMNRYCAEMSEYQLQLARRQRHDCARLKDDLEGKAKGGESDVHDARIFISNHQESSFRGSAPVDSIAASVAAGNQSFASSGDQVVRGSIDSWIPNSVSGALPANWIGNANLPTAPTQSWRQLEALQNEERQRQLLQVAVASQMNPSFLNQLSLKGQIPTLAPSNSTAQLDAALLHRALSQRQNEVTNLAMAGIGDLFSPPRDQGILAAFQGQCPDLFSGNNGLLPSSTAGRRSQQALPPESHLAMNPPVSLRQQVESTLLMSSLFSRQPETNDEHAVDFVRESGEDQHAGPDETRKYNR